MPTIAALARRLLLRPQLVELERRDTPAWWTIAAPTIAGGTPGSTAATITGNLTLNPDYLATNGVVTVWADSPVQAATLALAGTMNSKYADHDRAHAFVADNVGFLASEHKAFLVVADGTNVDILFEDMAGDPNADWDYNDRSWLDLPVDTSSNPVLFSGLFEFHDLFDNYGDYSRALVTEKVYDQGDGKYLWEFVVENTSLASDYGSLYEDGLSHFSFHANDATEIVFLPTPNWSGEVSVYSGGDGQVRWTGEPVFAGDSVTLKFQTPTRPIVLGSGQAQGPSGYENTFAGGELRVPGRNDVRIEIT